MWSPFRNLIRLSRRRKIKFSFESHCIIRTEIFFNYASFLRKNFFRVSFFTYRRFGELSKISHSFEMPQFYYSASVCYVHIGVETVSNVCLFRAYIKLFRDEMLRTHFYNVFACVSVFSLCRRLHREKNKMRHVKNASLLLTFVLRLTKRSSATRLMCLVFRDFHRPLFELVPFSDGDTLCRFV